MKKFKVEVVTTFYYEDEVEAETPEQAKKEMEEAINNGEVDAVSDTVDPDTVVRVIENEGDPNKKNGWQVAIDLTGDDQESNLAILSSPIYSTEEEAHNWYSSLDFGCYELGDINKGLDIIMIHWVNDQMEDTYLLS